MPELPEVETVRQALIPLVQGRTVKTMRLARPDLRWPMPENLAELVAGRKVGMPWRRGKYVLLPIAGAGHLLIHLGMSGSIRIHDSDPDFGKHDHVSMQLDDGRWWVMTDPRRFGHIDKVEEGAEDTHWLLAGMGPEPLGNHFTAPYLAESLAGRTQSIKACLLDQKIVAGIGNIYACEALYRAGISPRRQAKSVVGKRAERLVPAIRAVLEDAIAQGGTSLRDHVQPGGEIGYFVQQLDVYGRVDQPCHGCGQKVRQIKQSGRSSFYCSSCQR